MRARTPRLESKGSEMSIPKNTICLWYDKDAETAARFYAETFPDSAVGAIYRAPGDFPSGRQGDVLVVNFTVLGIPCIGVAWGYGGTEELVLAGAAAVADRPRDVPPLVVRR